MQAEALQATAVCPANGNACCSQASHDSSCCRKSECVTFNNCLADEMHLNAPEWLAVHNGTKILRDVTGAVIDVRFVEQGDVLEFARIYINSELTSQTTFDVCVQRLQLWRSRAPSSMRFMRRSSEWMVGLAASAAASSVERGRSSARATLWRTCPRACLAFALKT